VGRERDSVGAPVSTRRLGGALRAVRVGEDKV
jgi:hypothetical protein